MYIFLTILQLMFAYGINLLNYFTNVKLGMNRWVVYQNMQINKIFIIGFFKYFVGIIVIVLAVYIIKKYFNLIKKSLILKFDIIVLFLIDVMIQRQIFLYNTKTEKLNYFYILIFLIIYIVQIIKILIVKKNEI